MWGIRKDQFCSEHRVKHQHASKNYLIEWCTSYIITYAYLVNDSAAGFPEANAIFGTTGSQEIIDFAINVFSFRQIRRSTCMCLNKMVTMYSWRNGYSGQTAWNKLQHGHLSCCILHGHTIRPQQQVAFTSYYLLQAKLIYVTFHMYHKAVALFNYFHLKHIKTQSHMG